MFYIAAESSDGFAYRSGHLSLMFNLLCNCIIIECVGNDNFASRRRIIFPQQFITTPKSALLRSWDPFGPKTPIVQSGAAAVRKGDWVKSPQFALPLVEAQRSKMSIDQRT